MSGPQLVFQIVVYAALAAPLVAAAITPFRPVGEARIERFGRRQSLPITPDNRPVIVAYLATTRRWRGAGLLLGATTTGLYSWARNGELYLNLLVLFAGWFVGAVFAEWRVSTAASGTRRVASLVPRRAKDYLDWQVRWLLIAFWAALIGFTITGIATAARSHRSAVPALLGWLALVLVTLAGLMAVVRHVLTRPQPPADPDVLGADQAIRSRSLHVLAGSALAISGYLGSAVEAVLGPWAFQLTTGPVAFVEVGAIVLAPLLGLVLATSAAAPASPANVAVANGAVVRG